MKKILIAILMIGVTVLVGVGLYMVLFAPVSTPPPVVEPEDPENGTGSLPGSGTGTGTPGTGTDQEPGLPSPQPVDTVAQGGITQVVPVVPASTLGASLSANGIVSYYNRTDGRFYRIDASGNVYRLDDRQFLNASNVTLSRNGERAIIEYPDGANITYDFATRQQYTLPTHWEDFEFAPSGQEIVSKSMGIDPQTRYLVVSGLDGSSARPVQEMGENAHKVTVSVSPNNQIIATAETGQKLGVDRQEIFLIGKNNENFKSMVVEGLDFRPLWSPDGEQMLYSVVNADADWNPSLWIVDASGDNIGRNRRNVNVRTWADKCTFADIATVYCAVPTSLPRGAGLQPSLAQRIADEIVRVDLRTGLQTRIAVPEGGHTVEQLMVSPNGSALYFTTTGTGALNRINLR